MGLQDEINSAVDVLLRGGVAAFPTDTVYGLGVAACAAESPQALFDVKQRDAGKPVAWLVGGLDDLRVFGRDVPEYAAALAQAFWPGPLTLVVKASCAVPRAFRSDAGTIGLRMPANDTALALIRAVAFPLATTSANLSGKAAPCHFEDLDPAIVAAADAIVRDGARGRFAMDSAEDAVSLSTEDAVSLVQGIGRGLRASCAAGEEKGAVASACGVTSSGTSAASGVASTVLDCTAACPKMLREGSLSAADLCATVPGLRFAG